MFWGENQDFIERLIFPRAIVAEYSIDGSQELIPVKSGARNEMRRLQGIPFGTLKQKKCPICEVKIADANSEILPVRSPPKGESRRRMRKNPNLQPNPY